MEHTKKLNAIEHMLVRLDKLQTEIDDLKYEQAVLKRRIVPLTHAKQKFTETA